MKNFKQFIRSNKKMSQLSKDIAELKTMLIEIQKSLPIRKETNEQINRQEKVINELKRKLSEYNEESEESEESDNEIDWKKINNEVEGKLYLKNFDNNYNLNVKYYSNNSGEIVEREVDIKRPKKFFKAKTTKNTIFNYYDKVKKGYRSGVVNNSFYFGIE